MKHFRTNTYDQRIFDSVVNQNEYDLPDAFQPDDVIIDIGAHIGSFAYACLVRGAGYVHCYEPDPENYSILVRNLRGFGRRRYRLHNQAVWKPDETINSLQMSKYRDNTGSGSVCSDDGVESVHGKEIGQVLVDGLSYDKGIRLLKLDCEGAEFPILYSLDADPLGREWLAQVQEIVGEIHDMTEEFNRPIADHAKVDCRYDYTYKGMTEFLHDQGFIVDTWKHTSDGLRVFRARRA